ncbi:MAG: hypothetical protein WDN03_17910 [Rhizomicrobium sp.]
MHAKPSACWRWRCRRPRFDADAVARVRAQMQQSLLSDAQDPPTVALNRFYQVYFGSHPYAHPVNAPRRG